MSRWCLSLSVALAAAAQLTSAPAQVTPAAGGYQFRMKFTKGARFVYDLVSLTPKPANPSDPKRVEGSFTMTFVDVVSGVATIKIDSGPFFMDGRSSGQTNSVQVKMDSTGKIIQGSAGAAQYTGILLPAKPLRVGQSFTSKNSSQVATPEGMKAVTVTSKSTFAGITTVRNRKAAQFNVQLSATGYAPTTGTAIQCVDAADGQLLVAQIDQQAQTTANGKPVVVNNRLRIVRK